MRISVKNLIKYIYVVEEESIIPSSNVTMASTALQNLLKMERMLHNLFDLTDCTDQHLLQRYFLLISCWYS